MTETNEIVGSLNNKFKDLILLYDKSKETSQGLQEENERLRNKITEQESIIDELTGKYDSISLAKAFETSGEGTTEARLKVNKIVREIDNCIALLNR